LSIGVLSPCGSASMAARSIVSEVAPSFGSRFSRAWSITCIFWSSTAAGELGPGALVGAAGVVGRVGVLLGATCAGGAPVAGATRRSTAAGFGVGFAGLTVTSGSDGADGCD
jgi:hypothetical protein